MRAGKAWLLVVFFLSLALLPLKGFGQDEENKPTPEQARMYRLFWREVQAGNLLRHLKNLTKTPSRIVGYPGADQAADYILSEFRRLGLENVREERYWATVPVDEGASLTIEGAQGKPIPLYALWPNSVRTSQLPPEGLTLPMIYGGNGAIAHLNGKTVEGSVVLMDFNCGSEWLNSARLGARAILFIEPEETSRGEAEAKFLTVPLDMPRFWVPRKYAPALIALCRSATPPKVTLRCRMPWKRVPARNIFGVIPGTDPELKNQIIILEAYYDSMSVVPRLAPGAESASGVSALLELARIFKKYPPKRTLWFLVTSGHHLGLAGIRNWIEAHWKDLEQNSTRQNFKAWLTRTFPFLFHFKTREPWPIYLFIGLDLSTQTKGVGIFYKGWYYDFREDLQSKFSDIARVHRENAEKVAQVLNLNIGERFADGVNPISGKSWRNFIPAKPAFDAEAYTMAGGKGVTFASVDDGRMLVDTPLDQLSRINIANLTEQTKLIACLTWHDTYDPNGIGITQGSHLPIVEPSPLGRLRLQGGFAKIVGQVMEFDPRISIVPNKPILGSIAVLKKWNKSYMGVRGYQFELVDDQARFQFIGAPPLTAYGGGVQTQIAAYKVDDRTGELIYAPDLGVTGGKENYQTTFPITTGLKETGVVVFRCNTTALYDFVDPQALRSLPTINVLDSVSNGEPRMYGFDKTVPERLVSHVEDVALIYAQKGNRALGIEPTRVKILGSAGPGAIRMVLLNMAARLPNGQILRADQLQYFRGEIPLERLQPVDTEGQGYELKGGTLYNTPLLAAWDMYMLNDARIKKLARHRIINPAIDDLHNRGRRELQAALVAFRNRQWDEFDSRARAAWGYESRAYPDVRRTMNDVVKGVIFYLFLLLPFSYFFERLVIGSKFLVHQVIWTLTTFVGIFVIFRYVHPAFDITMNPLIVLLAFVMLALSILVIGMISGRFEKELKEFNKQISGVHRIDIGRMSIAAAAFSLGISNMRRRKARTILTCVTLILLTFTVLSFTSVVPTVRFNKVPAPGSPYYFGIMLRTPEWGTLEESAYRILRDEFSRTRPVSARAWFFGTQLGEQSFITLKRGDKRYDVKAVVGLTPEEERILEPGKRSLVAGRWFLPGDRNVVILPKQISDALNVTPEQVGIAKISFTGQDYTVIGIVDKDRFKEVKDLDTEPLTPVDFIQMNRLQSQGRTSGAAEEGFREYIHLEPDACAFIPFQTALNMGAEIRSIAVNMVTPEEVRKTLGNLMFRLGLNLYGGEQVRVGNRVENRTYRFSTIGATAAKGGGDVFIPILIAALIVLNTMLGSVYERVKEIGIYSSIGLAPNHIAALFIGEAMVYAVLGAVAGYLTGQIAAKIVTLIPGMGALYLNFSSLSAVLTTLVVVGVVLLSTLYPARKASEVATPAIERTWKVPEPEGDEWHITMPFAVTGIQAVGLNSFLREWFEAYEEYSIGDFVTQDVSAQEVMYENGRGYQIRFKAWLAPFDLGVSQTCLLETIPTEMEDVYELKLTIHRESGDVSNWKRINRRFLNTLRKQFLIWRTLRQEERERYLVQTSGEAQPVSS